MIADVVIIIPARYRSSRFPGKPLVNIKGKTLIHRVWERCALAVPKEKIYVATDDERIQSHCLNLGISVLMTSSECLTGTDRVYEAALQVPSQLYLNVQGDEPLIEPDDITKVWEAALTFPNDIINAMCRIESEEEYRSKTIPKVAATPDGTLLFMSRAPIPTTKSHSFVWAKKQVCIYAFTKEQLSQFYNYGKKTPLEEIEDIEILRFLELGSSVRMVDVSQASIAVDVPEDVKKVEFKLGELGI